MNAPPPLSGAFQGLPRRWRRVALWSALVGLLVVAQSMLVWLTLAYESTRAQDQVEEAAAAAAGDIRQALARQRQGLQALLWNEPAPPQWHAGAAELLRARRELLRLERRDAAMRVADAVDSPYQAPLFTQIPRAELEVEALAACATAGRSAAPTFSRSYYVPVTGGLGLEVMDLCMPVRSAGQPDGFMTATVALARLLDEALAPDLVRRHEISFVEGDGTRLARAGSQRGAAAYVADRLIDVPGQTLRLKVDSGAQRPQLIPNLAVALVLGLSLALAVVVVLLVHDVRRRAGAEAALAEALAFRKAMEDSLVTGLRARDLAGRITYVNPAFCEMVGWNAIELAQTETPPYWPPELLDDYTRRQQQRMDQAARGESLMQEAREGFETTFMRRSGERFPVLIFEAPLVDGSGQQAGWMSAVLDVSAQRRVEELSRQQQERLQASARLATVGEMASLLSHELNQPLAAIASYAAGTLNLLGEGAPDAQTLAMLEQAAQRIAEQAERAGRVIKSVHSFVRRREQARETVRADVLIDAVMPLVRLQARKSGTRIELDLPSPMQRVVCDRTMVEQVLLNLTRNAIQAMETATPLERRVLTIRVRPAAARWVGFSVIDRGQGIAPEVAKQLFTPFFTTRSEGMGLGLSLCRTVIEQHGGALDFEPLAEPGDPAATGTEFRFTLPAEAERVRRSDAPDAIASGNATETAAPIVDTPP